MESAFSSITFPSSKDLIQDISDPFLKNLFTCFRDDIWSELVKVTYLRNQINNQSEKVNKL